MNALVVILSNLMFLTGPGPAVQSGDNEPARKIGQPASHTASGRSTPAATTNTAKEPSALPRRQLLDNIGLLRGNNTPEARKLGAAQLLEAGTPDAITALGDALRGLPWQVDRGANSGDQPISTVKKPNPTPANPSRSPSGPLADTAAQLAVCEAVAQSTEPPTDLIEPLLSLLSDRRSSLTDAAATALQRFDPNVVVRRVRPLAADPSADLEARLTAIYALGTLGDSREAVSELAGLLEETSMTATLQAAALTAFRQATGEPAEDVETAISWWKDQTSMTQQAWAARRAQQRAADLRKTRGEIANLTGRLVVAYRETYLATPETERSKKLLVFLTDAQSAVRQLGLDLINDWITDRRAIPQEIRDRLVAMLTDPNNAVRLQATRIVGDLRLAAALGELTRALSQETDRFVRAAQINAIGRLDDPATTDLLLECLSDDVPMVVGEAVMALARTVRRLAPAQAQLEPIVTAILSRYQNLTPRQNDVREQFLTAMGLIPEARFRNIFEQEMQPDRPLRIRRASIIGLAAFADAKACDELLDFLSAAEPEIRVAAAEGLAKCGRRKNELSELAKHVDPGPEPDPLVRQAAWTSFLAISAQLPPEEQIALSSEFDRAGDLASQRRRLDLLRRLVADLRVPGDSTAPKAAGQQFDQQLSRTRRVDVLERIADAQKKLTENSSAAASLDQAIALIEDPRDPRYLKLALDSIQVRLNAREDDAAMDRVRETLKGHPESADSEKRLAPFFDAILAEIRSRSADAVDGPTCGEANRLLDLAASVMTRAGASQREEFDSLTKSFAANRSRLIDQGLMQLGADPDVESRILAFSRDSVLLRIHALLTGTQTTSRPANGLEERWVRLAKKIAPDWPGYSAGAAAHQRESALKGLLEAAKSTKQNTIPAAGTGVTTPKAAAARNS